MCQTHAESSTTGHDFVAASCISATMLLAEHAELTNGLVHASGLGWTWTDSERGPVAVVMNIAVPWSRAGRQDYRLELVTADGMPVHGHEGGERADCLAIQGHFVAERSPYLPPGRAMTTTVVVSFAEPGVALPPGSYNWQLTVGSCRHSLSFDVLECPRPDRIPRPRDETETEA